MSQARTTEGLFLGGLILFHCVIPAVREASGAASDAHTYH